MKKEEIVNDLNHLLENDFTQIDIIFKQDNGNSITVNLDTKNLINTNKNHGHTILELGKQIVNGVILKKEELNQTKDEQ
jgi:hypothetical protein